MRKVLLALLVMVLAAALVLSCGPSSPTPSPSPSPKPTASPSPTASPTASPKPTASPSPTATENWTEFYKKNVVEVVCPYAAGGGTDVAARAVTSLWDVFFGNAARINSMPGGGTVVGSNYVYKAKPDGLTLYITTFGTALASPVLYPELVKGVQFDVSKFTYLAFYADSPPTFGIDAKLPYKTFQELVDAKPKNLKLGTTTKMGMPAYGNITALALAGLLGDAGGTCVTGWDSTPEVGLAISRGEVAGMVFTADSMKKEADKGIVRNLALLGYAKSALLPDVKPVSELIKLTPEQNTILKVYDLAFKAGRVICGPPGMNPAQVKYLRDTLKKLLESPQHKALAMSLFGYWDPPIMGDDVTKLIKEVVAIPKADAESISKLADKYIK